MSTTPTFPAVQDVNIEKDGIKIRVDASHRDKDLVKQVPGARWDQKNRVWWTWCTWSACAQLRAIFGERLVIGPELMAWSTEEYTNRVQPCMELRDAEDTDLIPHDWPLFPRQRVGVAFLERARHAILGDEMGAGKTRQTIFTLERLDAYPAVIVATKSAKPGWRDEFAEMVPHRKIVIVEGSAAQRRKCFAEEADVYIIHWQILRYHSRIGGYGYIKLSDDEKIPKELNELDKKAVVLDEAHRLQDPKAKQTRAAWAICDEVPDEGVRLALTGTPLPNHLGNLWAVARAVSPKEWPSKPAFLDRYALMTWSPFGFNEIAGIRPETRDEFFKAFDPRFIRRPKHVVTPDLPDKVYMPPREVELPRAQRKVYDQMADELIAELDDGNVVMVTNPLARATRLRQFASATCELNEDGKVQMKEPSAVIDEFIEILGELEGKQVLYFSESRQLVELAAARLDRENIDTALITGSVKDFDREQRRLDFQAGSLRTLGLTMGAGGESLNLQAASAVVFLERSFSLVKNKQAEDRAHRTGQKNDVLIIDIVPKDTVYEGLREIVVGKEMNAEEVCRDKIQLRKLLERSKK